MLRLSTSHYNHSGADRLDVTRVGCDRAIAAGNDAPGAFAAPSPRILWPAKQHLDLVAALHRRAVSLQGSEAGAFVAVQAADLLARVDDAYRTAYVGELRRSYVTHRPAWDAVLARDTVTVVCFCRDRQPGAHQQHTCHRHHLAACLVACGAIDDGEITLVDSPRARAPRALPPLDSYVAISGCRPPPTSATQTQHEWHQRVIDAATHADAVVTALRERSALTSAAAMINADVFGRDD